MVIGNSLVSSLQPRLPRSRFLQPFHGVCIAARQLYIWHTDTGVLDLNEGECCIKVDA